MGYALGAGQCQLRKEGGLVDFGRSFFSGEPDASHSPNFVARGVVFGEQSAGHANEEAACKMLFEGLGGLTEVCIGEG